MSKNYDLIIIGFGKAGKTIAGKMANKGMNIALIEEDPKLYGGTCINVGCLPSKSLVHSAKILKEIEALGFERDFDWNSNMYKKSMEEKRVLVKKLNNKNFQLLNKNPNVTIYDGKARFIDDYTIEVSLENEAVTLNSNKIIINTGSKSNLPDISGVTESKNVLTSRELLDLEELPERLAIIGAGYIGLEFASYFTNFGTKVKVFQFDGSFLPREDEDDSTAVREHLTKSGVDFVFKAKTKAFKDLDNKVEVTYEVEGKEENETFDKVLVATGRIPNTEGLGLENTKVKIGERGEIITDEFLETSVKGIWAVGDVKGGPQFTFISLDDSRIVIPQLLNKDSNYNTSNRKTYPTSTFIDPPFARVGLNEKEANEKNIEYRKAYFSASAVPKANVLRETSGFLKVLVDNDGLILGATLFCAEAHEMINLLSLAINEKISYKTLRDSIYTHPVMTEALNDLLGQL